MKQPESVWMSHPVPKKRFMTKSKHSLKQRQKARDSRRGSRYAAACCVSGELHLRKSQEMVAFITELNANYYSVWFIKETIPMRITGIIKGFYLKKNGSRVVRADGGSGDILNAR